MFLFQSCMQSGQILCSTFDDHAVVSGVSDTIVVKHKDGTYKSSPFLVCFGPYHPTHKYSQVQIIVNEKLAPGVTFDLDKKGYVLPRHLTDKQINKLGLNFGMNKVTYRLQGFTIDAEIYLYSDNDKLVVSDVDGTATKSDVPGHVHNMLSKDYLHGGYAELMQKITQNGYKVVWLTMRALPLYNYSKKYLRQTCKIDAPIMTQPQEFTHAFFNEITKKTGNIKANVMNIIRSLFTVNPFAGGFGNRDNDAIAYHHSGVEMDRIFFIDTKSRVQQMSRVDKVLTYQQILDQIEYYFPYNFSPKAQYTSS